jgi:hypothetical protein
MRLPTVIFSHLEDAVRVRPSSLNDATTASRRVAKHSLWEATDGPLSGRHCLAILSSASPSLWELDAAQTFRPEYCIVPRLWKTISRSTGVRCSPAKYVRGTRYTSSCTVQYRRSQSAASGTRDPGSSILGGSIGSSRYALRS